MAHSLYCFKHQKPFSSFVEHGLPQAACLDCVHDKIDARIEHSLQEIKASTKRIKEACDGNGTRRSSKCSSNDIPAVKARP